MEHTTNGLSHTTMLVAVVNNVYECLPSSRLLAVVVSNHKCAVRSFKGAISASISCEKCHLIATTYCCHCRIKVRHADSLERIANIWQIQYLSSSESIHIMLPLLP